MSSTDHRSAGDVADDPIAGALRSLPVAAPLDDWVGVERRGHRRRRRHRLVAAGGSAMVVVLVVGVAALLVDRGDGDGALPVRAGDPTTVVPPDEVVDVSAVTWEPVDEDGRLQVAPAGPYVDGQTVTLDGPDELFDPNDRPIQCVVVDGRESCDPLWSTRGPDPSAPQASGSPVVVRRWILGPGGWQDCTRPEISCRLVQHGSDGANRATGRLDVVARPTDDDPPQVTAGDRGEVAAGTGTAIDLAGPAEAVPPPGEGFERQVTLCRFLPPATVPGASILPSDCQDVGSLPAPVDDVAGVGLPRSLYGIAGWHDCADGACLVLVTWAPTRGDEPDGGRWNAPFVGAGLVRFDPAVPDRARPQLLVEPSGPYQDDQLITVTGTGFPAGRDIALGQCNAGDPANGTDAWGQPWEDCRYSGPMSIPVAADGGFTVELPAIRQHLVLGIPDSGVDCALEPAGTCYLSYTPGKGYAEPMASVPLTFDP